MPYADPEAKKAYDREYGKARREARLRRGLKWRTENPERFGERQRAHHLRKKFGITQEQYEDLLAVQGGGCAICGSTETIRGKRSLCIDHDHATGKVRGILCHRCNVCIGQAHDDPELLRKAVAYLEGAP